MSTTHTSILNDVRVNSWQSLPEYDVETHGTMRDFFESLTEDERWNYFNGLLDATRRAESSLSRQQRVAENREAAAATVLRLIGEGVKSEAVARDYCGEYEDAISQMMSAIASESWTNHYVDEYGKIFAEAADRRVTYIVTVHVKAREAYAAQDYLRSVCQNSLDGGVIVSNPTYPVLLSEVTEEITSDPDAF